MGLVGQILQGTYRIERLIGRGGMGAVYECSHLRLVRRFAVKVLSSEFSEHPEALARFRREAEITSSLGHPHILEVIDFNYTDDGMPYIIMELLSGENLDQRLRKRPLSLEEVASIFAQTASALQAVHQRGIIHRDLKPQNLFLCDAEERDDYVKVVDFGISKVLGSLSVVTKKSELMGTPHFMSPEQIEGGDELDRRADVYAMGAIIYQALAGRPPFEGEVILSVLYKIVNTSPKPLDALCPDLPPSLAHVVHTALAKDREERFPSMRVFWQEFSGAMGGTRRRRAENRWLAKAVTALNETGETLPPHTSTARPQLASATDSRAGPDPQAQIQTILRGTGRGDPPGQTPYGTTLSSSAGHVTAAAPRGSSSRRVLTMVVSGLALVVAGVVVGLGLSIGSDPTPVTGPNVAVVDLRPDAIARPAPPPDAASAARIDVSTPPLEAARSVRRLSLDTKPSGGTVLIAGKRIGRAPLDGVEIPTGEVALVIKKPGFFDHSRSLPAGVDDIAAGTVELRPRGTRTATLQVTAQSRGALIAAGVFFDGKRIGECPLYRKGLAAGVHVVEARKPGFKSMSKPVRLRPGQTARVVFELERR